MWRWIMNNLRLLSEIHENIETILIRACHKEAQLHFILMDSEFEQVIK